MKMQEYWRTPIPLVTITPGFHETERVVVAKLFWQAFKGKLGPVMAPEHKALAFLTDAVDPEFALSARDAEGTLLGVAGIKTANGALVGGGLSDMARAYGWFGGLWRGLMLDLLERTLAPEILLMDCIFVSEQARGLGAGTALLRGIKDLAKARGLKTVRLDVIDINPRARALYEREGFVAQRTTSIGPLKRIFGFEKQTEMHYSVSKCRDAAS